MARRVVISLVSAEQEYQALQATDASMTAGRLGVEIEVLYAEDNAVLQIQQLFRCLHAPEVERPAALLVHTRVPDGLERVARNAAQAGVGWVLLNRTAPYIETLRREHPSVLMAAVTADHAEIGRVHGRQLIERLPAGGQVLYLQGPLDAPAARLRLEGLEQATRGRAYELRILNGEWTQESAEKAIAAWLRLKTAERFHPAIVVAQNDNMARGAQKSLEKLRPEWARLPFVGCDGLPEGGRRDVDEGRLAATVVMPSCAGPAVALAARWTKDGTLPPAETVLTPLSYPSPEATPQPKSHG
jgi:ABC-type sugar transport system substrate-binding protein